LDVTSAPERRFARHRSAKRKRSTLKPVTYVCLAGLLAFHAGPVQAATPAATCVAAKQKASGRWLDRTLGCLSRIARAGNGDVVGCLVEYDATLASSFTRAEARGGCPVVGDLQEVSNDLDACVGLIRTATALDDTPLPQTFCGADKLKASGRRLKADLACHGKAAKSGTPVDPACLAKAQARLDSVFTKADTTADCVQTDDADITSFAVGVCLANLLDEVEEPPTCTDGVQNGNETGIDCGGACPPCPVTPTCTDDVRNGTETDVDCGGGACPACAEGGVCAVASDCASNRCVSGRCAPPDGSPVCARWLADRATLTEGTWSGNVATCSAGDVSAAGRASALRSLNLYRWLAGLPPAVDDAVKNQRAQACALLLDANNQLRHDPPPSWTCWTQEGADGAGSSNIATTRGVAAVDLYMFDPGNATTIGHRRWILSNWVDKVGLGSTSSYSCMSIFGDGNAGKPWTAWPPPGVVPYAATRSGGFGNVDVTGWTVQSDTIDLSSATVTVREDGIVRPVSVTRLDSWYGSQHAIRFNPSGWTSAAGRTYEITVGNVATPIVYTVTIVNCS
jgi:hypothetical protein